MYFIGLINRNGKQQRSVGIFFFLLGVAVYTYVALASSYFVFRSYASCYTSSGAYFGYYPIVQSYDYPGIIVYVDPWFLLVLPFLCLSVRPSTVRGEAASIARVQCSPVARACVRGRGWPAIDRRRRRRSGWASIRPTWLSCCNWRIRIDL